MLCVLLFVLNVFLLTEAKLEPLIASESYTHSHVVDSDNPNQYRLFWKLLKNDEIQFEIHAKTTGWVGFGVSPNGGMKGADIAIGWVSNNVAYLKDCYSAERGKPLADEQQDLTLIEGSETGGYTILKFKRKLETCDTAKDVEIKIGSNFVIFAWNPADPATGNNDWAYHGNTNRFTYNLALRDYKTESIDVQFALPSKVSSHVLTMPDIRVPKKDTFYYCQLFKMPAFTQVEHLVQFEMVVNQKNKQNVHHLLVYECEEDFVPKSFPYSQECGAVPLDYEIAEKCFYKMIIAWGIGGNYKYSFPKEAGYPFVKSDKDRYLLIEMHYDNPKLLDNIVDNSGIKLYLTPQLRKYNLGLLTLGSQGTPTGLQIPPKMESIEFTSICHSKCTERYIPTDGVTVVGALLHTHLLGTAVSTGLVRKNVQIRKLFDNPNYDFNYQYILDIEPTKVYPGDTLITKCRYSSMNRTKFTFFGHSTYNEMCFDFIYYYPKIDDLTSCLSFNPEKLVLNFYKSLIDDKLASKDLLPDGITEEGFYANMGKYVDYLENKHGDYNDAIKKRFKEFFETPRNQTYFCGGSDFSKSLLLPNDLYYQPEKVVTESSKCNPSSNSNMLVNIPSVIFLGVLVAAVLF